jgi:uncharacterized protein (DUF58 family)
MLRKLLAMLPREERHRSMWKNFAQSIGLLAVALMAALYSSSAARDGRVASAGISALLALAIALWVGFRFVPRLARGVDWDWVPFISQYRVTRAGWIYFIAVTIVIFACINTSNNLLYMVLAGLLAVLLLSGFLSALNFRVVDFDIRVPATCFAGAAFPFSVQIKNRKRVFPTFSLRAGSLKDGVLKFEPFFFPVVHADGQTAQSGEAAFERRGRYNIKELKVSSRYPFGFFTKGRDYDVESECVCFPAIIPQEQMNFAVRDTQGTNQRFERGRGYDLYTIRDYFPPDSARHVHWKASAKTNSLKTREYAAEESRRAVLGFDRFGNSNQTVEFEHLVSYTASLAFYLMGEGIEVAFISDDWQTGYGNSEGLLESILSYLAVVEMSPSAAFPEVDVEAGALMMSLREKKR